MFLAEVEKGVLFFIYLYLFQWQGLLSGLGGALSLYMGIAIIMAFEVVELLVDLTVNLWWNGARSGGTKY